MIETTLEVIKRLLDGALFCVQCEECGAFRMVSEFLEDGIITKGLTQCGTCTFKQKKFLYGISYQTITEESAREGDYADHGWELEKEVASLDYILSVAEEHGIISYGSVKPCDWWESVDPDFNEKMQHGHEKFYHLHIENIDNSSLSLGDWNKINDLLG
jgi:hypothetical protein